MFPIQLETEPSAVDLAPEEEPEEEPVVIVDELTLSINEDIFQCFGLFDKNRTGFFPIKYLSKALQCLGIFLTSFELDELKDTIFKNDMVEYETFKAYASDKIKESDQFDALRAAFRTFDPENEGILPADRFKKWMTSLGTPLTDKEVKELIKLGDPANKGFIVYDDLVGLLLS